jgi:glyoxylase-like metal-dependent hydrolase (beta-lactamase superfamily II)
VNKISVGGVTVYAIHMGWFEAKLSFMVRVPKDDRPSDYAEVFERRRQFPFRTVVVDTGTARVLIDPCRPDWMIGTKYEGTDCRPGPSMVVRLAEIAIGPETITHVVMTHYHPDHASGFTVEQNRNWAPVFPKARYYLGRGDWECRVQAGLADPTSRIARSIGVVHALGLLELVNKPLDLVDGVRLIPAPGESPGHLIVRVRSENQTFYYIGDLYHAPVEVEHPTWMAPWNDREANLRSRSAFTKAALTEHALVLGSHLPLARLRQKAGAIIWVPETER